jgi:hypothetical protein
MLGLTQNATNVLDDMTIESRLQRCGWVIRAIPLAMPS